MRRSFNDSLTSQACKFYWDGCECASCIAEDERHARRTKWKAEVEEANRLFLANPPPFPVEPRPLVGGGYYS